MRRLLCALILISACSNPTAPSAALAGTWAENVSIVGASLILAVDGSGNGSGTYAIEAGRSGTFVVRYDYGPVRTFTGTQTDADHLSGTFDDSSGAVVFTRR